MPVTGKGPLSGAGVVVTRDEDDAGPLTTALTERGARVLHWGSIGVAAPEDWAALEKAMARIGEYDWICFSSPRAVHAVVSRVGGAPFGLTVGPRTAVVGPATAAALSEAGWPVDRFPEEASARGLVRAFRVAGDAPGARVLFPASAIAREEIPEGLARLGAVVDRVTAYRMTFLPLDRGSCLAAVDAGEVDAVTFASPSAMEGLRQGLGHALFHRVAELTPAAAMGPTTAAALEEAGWSRVVVAKTATMEGLAEAAEAAVRAGRANKSLRRARPNTERQH
jgi:uroporphyrinogen III methyltransferase/synthase